MRKLLLVALAGLSVLMVPSQALAWGAQAHQLIMRRAIDLLPAELKPFYEHYREELVLRSNDPDLWRNVPWDDDSNHFLNFGIPEFGKAPFEALPRERGAALAKFGEANLTRWGTLPWRVEELAGSLRRAFEGVGRRSLYSVSDVVLFSATTAHYLMDATQPFHATDNYDGQKTGNFGIHSRFERDLVEKFGSRLRLSPAAPTAMRNPRDTAFDTTINSYALVDQILAADTAAIGKRDTYDDEYFERFFTSVQPIVERQLNEAITLTASLIVGAWEQAGRPTLYTAQPRPVQRVRR
ncbi:MAG: hypothetical protein JSU08_20340 [Acidobacteria bacterium]|nr:hypothetical protein [Acidobacteriota bacterium]